LMLVVYYKSNNQQFERNVLKVPIKDPDGASGRIHLVDRF
jgi:hypothetical protein